MKALGPSFIFDDCFFMIWRCRAHALLRFRGSAWAPQGGDILACNSFPNHSVAGNNLLELVIYSFRVNIELYILSEWASICPWLGADILQHRPSQRDEGSVHGVMGRWVKQPDPHSAHSLIHPLPHPITHPSIYLFIQLNSPTPRLTDSLAHSITHLCFHSSHSPTHPLTHKVKLPKTPANSTS